MGNEKIQQIKPLFSGPWFSLKKKMFEILGISCLISVNQTNLESFYDDRFPVSVGR